MDYPIDKLQNLAIKIQQCLADHDKRDKKPEQDYTIPFDEMTRNTIEAMNNFMAQMRTEILPEVQETLGEIESLLPNEVSSVVIRISPILSKAKLFANNPTNPLGYNELASLLMNLKGQIPSSKKIQSPVSENKKTDDGRSLRWLKIAGVAAIVIVILTTISTFHLLDGSEQTKVIVVHESNPTTSNVTSTSSVDTKITNPNPTKHDVTTTSDGGGIKITNSKPTVTDDNFLSDASLNTQLWNINGPLLQDLSKVYHYHLVSPDIAFQPLGMYLNVNSNQFNIGGIESVNAYSPPFTITTTFQHMSRESSAGLVLRNLSGDNYLSITGNSADFCNYNYATQDYPTPKPVGISNGWNSWCPIKISIDALGIGTVTLYNSENIISIGKGPFYLIINQQAPPQSQPSSSIWKYVNIVSNERR